MNRDQILEIADDMSNTTIIMPKNEDLIAFAEAILQHYKAELLKEVGEPVAYQSERNGFICKENKNPEYNTGLFTSDQVAAAVLKATKPLEEDITEMRTDHLMLVEENHALREQLATAEQRVAEACADLYIDDLNNGAPFIANRMREGEWRKFVKEV